MTKHGEEESFFTYDVFLSFRGEDTRHNFIGHLRKELATKGINAFLDDENLRIGEDISPTLSKAIEDSKVLITVFSENYANSTWCLDELVKIRDCLKNNKQVAVPIFYHVDPSDVRHQRNSYGEAMIKHENRFGKDSKKVDAWKSALNELANLKGQHITTGYETNFIEKIVKDVHANIAPKPFHDGEDPVGLEQRLEEVKSLLNMKPNDDTVSMLGIYGLGGIGKTEIAKAMYEKIAHQFDAASFLANVREKSNKINGMEDLQKTLLSEMGEQLTTELGSMSRGKYEIKQKLHRKKVLLVLDDVDDEKLLENMAGGCDWFGPGSRIIITTRDKKLLIDHRVENIYEMIKLNDQHSLKLFCQHAFKQSHPEIGYEALSSRAISYAKGFPLALKVIGSDLAIERSLDAWESTLEKYERALDRKIQGVLKVSYDRLGDNEKRVFLDIACFFKEEKREYVKKILEEYDATSTIDVLVNKSLLMVENGFLNMHDLIQDMGRSIVMQEAPNPGKRSRLWLYRDVIEVLNEDSGSDAIEGIMLNPPQQEVVDWSGDSFKRMKWLRILIVRNTSFTTEPKHLPNHLRVLDWEKYPLKSFPEKFQPGKIVVFNLSGSNLTLEEPLKKFSSLTKLNLSHNQSIVQIPDVSEVQNLRELRLDYCKNLIAVHESVGFLKNLIHLSVSECTKLKDFLQRMFLPSLQVLDISDCSMLSHFPDITKEMDESLKIYMSHTSIICLPDSIANLTGLVSINLNSSKKLISLPFSLFMLPNVEAIKMNKCTQLKGFFREFLETHDHFATNGHHSKLKTLKLENIGLSDEDFYAILILFPKLENLIAPRNNFVSLHVCMKESIHLTRLDVSDCKILRRIPQCINLRFLDVNHCEHLEEISELPSTIEEIDARYCFSLTRDTSIMLWSQVSKERSTGIAMLMPSGKEIPEWFHCISEGGYPRFWARGKFPDVTVALVFHKSTNVKEEMFPMYAEEEIVKFYLVINGQHVPREDFDIIAAGHVFVCNLRVLFGCKEDDLDALLFLDWNEVQVSYRTVGMLSSLTLTSWGIFVYKGERGTNMEDVKFMCPDDPNTMIVTPPPPTPTSSSDLAWERLNVISYEIGRMGKASSDISELEQKEPLIRRMRELCREGKELTESQRYNFQSDEFSSLMDIFSNSQRDIDEAAEALAFYIEYKDHLILGPVLSVARFIDNLENEGGANLNTVLRRLQNMFIPPQFHINIGSTAGEESSSTSTTAPGSSESEQQHR